MNDEDIREISPNNSKILMSDVLKGTIPELEDVVTEDPVEEPRILTVVHAAFGETKVQTVGVLLAFQSSQNTIKVCIRVDIDEGLSFPLTFAITSDVKVTMLELDPANIDMIGYDLVKCSVDSLNHKANICDLIFTFRRKKELRR